VIVVSHRGPYRFEPRGDGSFSTHRSAGGVVSALGAVLDKAGKEATWIAAAFSDDDREAARSGAIEESGIDLRLIAIDTEAHAQHYDVISNGVLWFLFHDLFDRVRRPAFDRRFREAWEAYTNVNAAFAASAADELCAAMASNPAGFHSSRWARAYQQSARAVLGRSAAIAPAFAASLGPDVAALDSVAASDETREATLALDDVVGDRLVIARCDRIELSKNIVRGFQAYDRLLEARSGLRGRVVFVAMLYPSRQGLASYLAYASEIEQVVARVNDRWSTRDWTPIVLDQRDDFPRSVAAMQRYDVLLVNPIKDGLNLVAKEGPAVNRRDGLLCLSPEAGAYDELRKAVLPIHPYDIEDAAGTLDRALATPLDERANIAARLRVLATARNPTDWIADLVSHAKVNAT
jgi:trehalose 6-phosphate synthase